mmetsp:Transcript_85396/g.174158  ORF Transcript_85396/g.174158 Transcript_85396/m.174158 type:complete len:296 (-) Transcript_85396:104-991(-)
MQTSGSKSAPLGYQALSTAIVKSTSAPTLRPLGRTGTAHQQSQALMCSGVMALSPVDGKLNGRMVAQGCWGTGPKKSGVFKKNLPKHITDKSKTFEAAEHPATQFRRFYERSDLPISVHHGTSPSIDWKVEPERLDYIYLLPIFFDGLCEKESPYSFLAYRGIQDMLNAARGKEPSLICPAVPSLIIPLKKALNSRDIPTMCKAINTLQHMVRCEPRAGELLVPYYRQLLPAFNLYFRSTKNMGDAIDYSQRKRENLGELISETLELLERTGGEDAFINIKYMIPAYESCMLNGH